MTHSAMLKEKDCRSRILYSGKIPFSSGKVIKTLSSEEKHGDFSPKDHPKRAGKNIQQTEKKKQKNLIFIRKDKKKVNKNMGKHNRFSFS